MTIVLFVNKYSILFTIVLFVSWLSNRGVLCHRARK